MKLHVSENSIYPHLKFSGNAHQRRIARRRYERYVMAWLTGMTCPARNWFKLDAVTA